ncbi:copia protein [Trichonephila clavipes]|nr:copia protein [Trichonephila clavipes]
MAKESLWFKNISPEVMDIYLADKNSKMMSQGTGNVSAKTTTSSPRTGRIQIPVLELNDVQNQIPVRRSERLKSKLMSVHLVNNVPNSYFEAENSANWKNWKLAMENELDSLDKHKVCEIVQKPAKSKVIKTKWVYSLKQDDAGKNIKYKARLVAAGFNQIKNIDYSESYSPVVNIESFRLLIALAAKLKLNANFFDVKTAYLYGDLEETVYVLPPPGYEKLIGDDKVCKLKKSIYGLPQSGRNWNEKVSNHGSIPIAIDCNVVAFIVFEEGFHQPIKRTKQIPSMKRRPMHVKSVEAQTASRRCGVGVRRGGVPASASSLDHGSNLPRFIANSPHTTLIYETGSSLSHL